MRVALDITPALIGNTGVARYATSVWEQLLRREDVEVRPFGAGPRNGRVASFRHLRVPLRALHAAWRLTDRPRAESIVGEVDVVHSIDLVPPPTRHPLVMTIHDVDCVTHPELHPPRAHRLQRHQLAAARNADVILTTCLATAEAISTVGDIPRERIVVAPPGARRRSIDRPSPVVAPPYLLAVGAITPRKGLEVLVQAVAALGGLAPPLIIAGPDGWKANEVRQRILAFNLGDRVRIMGEVSDTTLQSLYIHASVVCHPSLAEGFGLPCIEAMAFGSAVIASDLPPIREIGDESVVLVPPADPFALADAIGRLLRDDVERSELSRLAAERAGAYTWEETIAGVCEAYSLAVKRASR